MISEETHFHGQRSGLAYIMKHDYGPEHSAINIKYWCCRVFHGNRIIAAFTQ